MFTNQIKGKIIHKFTSPAFRNILCRIHTVEREKEKIQFFCPYVHSFFFCFLIWQRPRVYLVSIGAYRL